MWVTRSPHPFQSGLLHPYNGLMVFTELGLSPYGNRELITLQDNLLFCVIPAVRKNFFLI